MCRFGIVIFALFWASTVADVIGTSRADEQKAPQPTALILHEPTDEQLPPPTQPI
jgi:hypothetical protein